MADEQPPAPEVTATATGAVDLHAPFFRQLESDRGLPPGILSAMAEKESGGNALKVNADPRSTASGLFQITAPTARDWGLSAEDRFDPVKSATVVADTLARRANQFGIERAVGMHYGGQGTPFTQTVGASGLSPAQYSSDVIRRSAKYGGAAPDQTVGFPSPAFDESAQPSQEQQFYRQYLQSTAPDGSSTIREVVSPSLLDANAAAAHEKDAGYTFTGFVDPGKMAAVPRAAAEPVQPAATPAPAPDKFADWRAQVPPPGASSWLNFLPPALSVAAPLALTAVAPEVGIPAMMAAAAFGGGTGEAGRQYLSGEPFSARDIATQAAVSGLTEGGMQVATPYVLGPLARQATGQLGTTVQAAEDLGPVLASRGTTVTAPAASAPPPPLRVTELHPIDLAQSTPQTMQVLAKQATEAERPALAAAWVNARRLEAANSGNPVTYMRAAYERLGPETQQALFGAQKGAYERMLQTAWGGTGEEMTRLGVSTAIGSGGYGGHLYGVPLHVPGLAMTRAAADITAPFAARGMLLSPGAARFGANVSSVGNVAGPAASRFAAQSLAERARQAGLPNF